MPIVALAGGIAWLLAAAAVAIAASPTPAPAAGDPRSAGQGPGLVGDPGFAIGLVVLVGLASLGLSLAYVRLTSDRDDSPRS
jgi:hypothetical protein